MAVVGIAFLVLAAGCFLLAAWAPVRLRREVEMDPLLARLKEHLELPRAWNGEAYFRERLGDAYPTLLAGDPEDAASAVEHLEPAARSLALRLLGREGARSVPALTRLFDRGCDVEHVGVLLGRYGDRRTAKWLAIYGADHTGTPSGLAAQLAIDEIRFRYTGDHMPIVPAHVMRSGASRPAQAPTGAMGEIARVHRARYEHGLAIPDAGDGALSLATSPAGALSTTTTPEEGERADPRVRAKEAPDPRTGASGTRRALAGRGIPR